MSNRKKIIYILLISFLFLPSLVKAQNGFLICNQGYIFSIEPQVGAKISENDFYENSENLNLEHQFYNGNYNDEFVTKFGVNSDLKKLSGEIKNGKFEYLPWGYWKNNGNSATSDRCYVIKKTEKNSAVSVNGSVNVTTTTTENTYFPKYCGWQYRLEDLKLKDEVDEENGTTRLTIEPERGSKIEEVFDRLIVSYREYKGVNNDNGGYGNLNYDKQNKKIIISGIEPAKSSTTSHTYRIGLSLEGFEDVDFPDGTDKATYMKSCGSGDSEPGIFIGEHTIDIQNESTIKIKNPKSQLCNELKQLEDKGVSKSILNGYISECSAEYITYEKNKTLDNDIRDKIDILNKIYKNATNYKTYNENDKLSCVDDAIRISSESAKAKPFETKVTYEKVGNYFGMVCVESYYVDGGTPRLVQAGMGIDYENKIEIKKTCSIFQVNKATKLPKCEATFSLASCLHNGKNGTFTKENGGPNSSFDSCVSKCDGGKYTQKCINSCYTKVYDDDRIKQLSKNSFNKFSYDNLINNYNINSNSSLIKINDGFIDNFKTVGGDNGIPSEVSWNGYTGEKKDIGGGYTLEVRNDIYYGGDFNKYGTAIIRDSNGEVVFQNGYSQYCANNANICTVKISMGPTVCSKNPDGEYKEALEKAKGELQQLSTIATQDSGILDYTMSFQDTKTYDIYKISGSSYDDDKTSFNEPRLVISKDEEKSKREVYKDDYIIGSDIEVNGSTQNGITSTNLDTVYTIKLPKTYTKVGSANEILIQDNVISDKYYTIDTKKSSINDNGRLVYKFSSINNNNNKVFSEGQNVYYTNLYSSDFNVVINSNRTDEELEKIANVKFIYKLNNKTTTYRYELNRNYDNIKTEFQVGYKIIDDASANEKTTKVIAFEKTGLSCYYGVYRFICEDKDCYGVEVELEPPTPTPTPTPDQGETTSTPSPVPSGGSSGNTIRTKSGLRYYYREIKLNDIFPNREPRWNWSGNITTSNKNISNGQNLIEVTGAANNDNPNYIVNPTNLIKNIEGKKYSIYSDDSEIDYSYILTPSLINEIRKYNRSKVDGKKRTYLDFSIEKNSLNSDQSAMFIEWFPSLSSTTTKITNCNNAKGDSCDNLEVKK